jgi:uncharacterized membrane protein YhiD involved in acid resistance
MHGLKAFAIIYVVILVGISMTGGSFTKGEDFALVGVLSFFVYMVFGKSLIRMFEKSDAQKAQKAYEDQQRQNQERERNQRLEDKRQELAIEFDHLQKIMFLQANLDQGKLDKLQSMQTALKSAKNDDLDTLRRQIETMKRG